MENNKINAFLKDILLDKFLVNFIPGLILFYVVNSCIDAGIGEGLTSLLIVTSASWTLGVLLEMVLFRKDFNHRWNGGSQRSIDSLTLLFGKTGISTLIACLFWIDLEWIHDVVDNDNGDETAELRIAIKCILFCAGGFLLYWMYRKQKNSRQ